jgi:plasmid stabilization system protein ParE
LILFMLPSPPTGTALADRPDIVRWIHDATDQARERFVGCGLLVAKFPPIVRLAHAADDMSETPLGVVGRPLCPLIKVRAVRRRS